MQAFFEYFLFSQHSARNLPETDNINSVYTSRSHLFFFSAQTTSVDCWHSYRSFSLL